MPTLPLLLSLQYSENPIEDSENPIEAITADLRLSDVESEVARRLFSVGLPPLVNKRVLAYLLGVSFGLVRSMSNNSGHYYRMFTIPKHRGGRRRIEAPRQFLKTVQRWLYDHVLSEQVFPHYVHGFVRGRDIFSNVESHLASKNLMVVDIRNFFPSVGERKVVQVFRNIGYPSPVAVQLAGLCSLHRRLPQGAPTSPVLANIAFAPTDEELKNLADSWDCNYSRYADDLAISGDRKFTRKDIDRVAAIVGSRGFAINRQKSRIVGGGARQMVTGLVVNKSGLPPRWKRKQWRAQFHNADQNPYGHKGSSSRLRGIASFINQYNSELAGEYYAIADRVALQEQEG